MPDPFTKANGVALSREQSLSSTKGPAKLLFGKYELGKMVGCGAFAKVYHARQFPTGQSVALKVLSKPRIMKSGMFINVRREIVCMRRIQHPHVVKLIDVMASQSKIYLVLEYIKGGELFPKISSKGRLPEDSARDLFRQLLSAVAFCHSRGVFHRDLKLENLLLDEFGKLKVSDFGLSALSPNAFSNQSILFKTLCGTPAYVAPEVISRHPYDAAKVDLWACGVILFILSSGYLPFNDVNLMLLYRKIYKAEYHFPKWISPNLQTLISRMLDSNPDTRITVDEIINDPWFRYGLNQSQIDKLMQHQPEIEDRISKVNQEEETRNMNAFDLISLSFGFDLSGLFLSQKIGKQRLISPSTVEEILDKVEEVGRRERYFTLQRKGNEGRGMAVVHGSTGGSLAWVEIYRLNKYLVLIEVEQGEVQENEEENGGFFWKTKLLPALQGLGTTIEPKSPSSPSSPVSVLAGPSSGSGAPDMDESESESDSD
ncbi:CBL-interacting Serine/Threonine-kinase [Rhynchospora pubera]|uniref:non-specific serine/threonine protein kinase n=1 Tax=Rhynchospora pubera TaxID=906938 RepID=A0AAV8F7Y7_9POAL|nr:CBL-interacting Serine/Threonine-kinase [Rhynchospora pubera]KAJ4786908.1 CBL-interacting Serine/Threonine-kinase [Rhynchospora pubera]